MSDRETFTIKFFDNLSVSISNVLGFSGRSSRLSLGVFHIEIVCLFLRIDYTISFFGEHFFCSRRVAFNIATFSEWGWEKSIFPIGGGLCMIER